MGLSEKIKVPFLKSPSNTKSKKNYKFFKEKTGNLDDLVRLHKKKKKDEPEPNIKVIKIAQPIDFNRWKWLLSLNSSSILGKIILVPL